jgi:hypothetical protein
MDGWDHGWRSRDYLYRVALQDTPLSGLHGTRIAARQEYDACVRNVIVQMSGAGRIIRPVCGGMFDPGPDLAELRAWAADEAELGKRVADDFLSTGRCRVGTLDRHFFEVAQRKFPDPADAPERVAVVGRRSLCQDGSHFREMFPERVEEGGVRVKGGVHSAPPAGKPLHGLFWTADVTHGLVSGSSATVRKREIPESRPGRR